MEVQRNRNNRTYSISDTDSEASNFESFHSSDSPPPLPPPPSLYRPPTREELVSERGRRFDQDHDDVARETRRATDDVATIVRRSRKDVMVKRAEICCRVCEIVLCLVSFTIMVSDKTKGWAGDSYYRYIEYRYCAAVTAIGSLYSGFQACDLAIRLIRGKHMKYHRMRNQFDFAVDQILAYLLISASSSGATRMDDWILNWGKDEFTEVARASIVMSFLAFAAFSVSSLISGYNLFM